MSSRSPAAATQANPTQADQGPADDTFEGPAEQAGQEYTNLLIRIKAELKDLADPKKQANIGTSVPARNAIKDLTKKLLDMQSRFKTLEANKPTVTALVQQADFATLRTHLDAASALLDDIITSLTSLPQLLTKDRRTDLKEAKTVLDTLLDRAPEDQATKAGTIRKELEKIVDGDINGVNALIDEASALVEADNLRGDLKGVLTRLAADATKFPTPNPVSTQLNALIDRAAEADALAPGSTRNVLWSSAITDAIAARNAAVAALKVKLEIANTLHVAEVAVQQTPKSAPNRETMLALFKPVRDQIGSQCAKATKVEDVEKNWQPLIAEAKFVAAKVADWAKTLVDADKVKNDLAELLKMTKQAGFKDLEKAPAHQKEAAEIKQRAETDPKTLAAMDPTKLGAFAEQIIKDLKLATKVLVDTADPAKLAEEMDARAAGEQGAEGAAQVEFWKAALEKRFGFKIAIPGGVDASKLPQLYRLIVRQPPSQVMKDLIDNFNCDTQAGPCVYQERKIVMTHMTKEIPEEAAHVLKYPTPDGGKEELVDYFSILTLHEIGHAVDDKKKTMPRTAGSSGPGTWKVETFDDVVDKIAALMRTGLLAKLPAKDVTAMAREFLMTGKVSKPPSARAPLGSLPAN